MKTKIILILFLVTTFSVVAQNDTTPTLDRKWSLGLNFSAYTFNSESNFNNLFISLERKINDQFFISLSTGIGSHKLNNSNSTSFSNESLSGNTITKVVNTEFEQLIRIPLRLSLKYQPFDWNIAPYLAFGYGMEYYFGYNSTSITKNSTRSAIGNLLSEDELKTIEKNNGGFRSTAHYSIGASYKFNSNLYFDANVLFKGFDPAYLSIGIKYGL